MNIKRKSHNKLIRDKILEILDEKNIMYEIKTLSPEEYIQSLFNKIFEELNEFKESQSIEEFADLIEVTYAIRDFFGWTKEEVKAARLAKLETNGGFEKRLFLINTTELEENK